MEVLKIDNDVKEKESNIMKQINELNAQVYNKSLEIERDSNNKINETKQKISEISNETTKLNVENKNLESKNKQNKDQIEKLKTSDTCPTCGRKFDNFDQTHLIQEIQKLIDNNVENNKQINENNVKIKENDELSKKLNEEVKEINDNLSNNKLIAVKPYQDNIQKLNKEYADYLEEKSKEKDEISKQLKDTSNETNMLNEAKQKIDTYKSNIAVLENEINNIKLESTENYENMIKDSNDKLVKLIKEKENLQKESNDLEEQIGVATHSISLISKEFKNYLLKSAIDFLNSKLEYYSNMLFSNDSDKIKFLQDGNKLDIYLGDALFESLSGGEKRKVDIAIMLAQKDLANNMSGTYSNLLILDEITDGLDSKSIDIGTSILMDVSKDISSMFVVTHKDTTIGRDKQLLVIKGKDRISYIQ